MYTQCYVHTDCQEVWVTRVALILEGKIPHLDTTFFFCRSGCLCFICTYYSLQSSNKHMWECTTHRHICTPVSFLGTLGHLIWCQSQQPNRLRVVGFMARLRHLTFGVHVLVSTCENRELALQPMIIKLVKPWTQVIWKQTPRSPVI